MEEWKDFEFNNRKYKISSFGNIYSVATGNKIKERLSQDGYPIVTLGAKDKRLSRYVHRLVATYFVENKNPEEFTEINHIDFDRKNYRYDNLEWVTHRNNIYYSIENNRMYFQNNNMNGVSNPNYGNKQLSKMYKQNPELAKEKQGRPGIINGRCVKIAMHDSFNNSWLEFDYIRECATYLIKNNLIVAKHKDYVANKIAKCLKNGTNNYSGFTFKTI